LHAPPSVFGGGKLVGYGVLREFYQDGVMLMYHSSFTDAHKGRRFTMHFGQYPNGVIAQLEIEGQPKIEYSDKLWPDKDAAKEELEADARRMIDGLNGQPS
jgi:hypothetical protein